MARSSHVAIPQQPKHRLYGRKAREARRRDSTARFRRSQQTDWPDSRATIKEAFDWDTQDMTLGATSV